MHEFHYRNNELWCEDVPHQAIARKTGTPAYVYSHRTLDRHFTVFDQAFAKIDHLVCFAVKSNSNVAILRVFARRGGGVTFVGVEPMPSRQDNQISGVVEVGWIRFLDNVYMR